jgi:hypothetical protein
MDNPKDDGTWTGLVGIKASDIEPKRATIEGVIQRQKADPRSLTVRNVAKRYKSDPDSPDEDLSVRELIALLKGCPDQDAYVVLPEVSGGDMSMVHGLVPKVGLAVVELIRGGKGYR